MKKWIYTTLGHLGTVTTEVDGETIEMESGTEVYVASEVDAEHSELIAHNVEAHARIAELEAALSRAIELFQDECDPVSEPDSYAWLQSTRELMER